MEMYEGKEKSDLLEGGVARTDVYVNRQATIIRLQMVRGDYL
jgi:hypothetical protein